MDASLVMKVSARIAIPLAAAVEYGMGVFIAGNCWSLPCYMARKACQL
jgi:hypothetical protein